MMSNSCKVWLYIGVFALIVAAIALTFFTVYLIELKKEVSTTAANVLVIKDSLAEWEVVE